MRYLERRLIGYSQEQMFKIVQDIGSYRLFLPHVTNSAVTWNGTKGVGTLNVGFLHLEESFTCNLVRNEPKFINAINKSHLMDLNNTWRFTSLTPNKCSIDFEVEFEFKSMLYAHISSLFLNRIVKSMGGSFENRAKILYGQPSCFTTIQRSC